MNPCPSYLHLRVLELQGYTRTLVWDWKRCSKRQYFKFWDVVYSFLETTSVIHKNVQGFDYSRERTSTFKPSSSGIGCRAQPTCDGPPTPPPPPPPCHTFPQFDSAVIQGAAYGRGRCNRATKLARGSGSTLAAWAWAEEAGQGQRWPPGLRSARSGEGPADSAGECAPTGSPAQPLGGSRAGDRPLPCSAAVESASTSGSLGSGLPWDASRNPGPWELS